MVYSQDYAVSSINPQLYTNANAIVRNEAVEISVLGVDKMRIKTKRVVTVLNKFGERHLRAYDFYDENIKIKDQEARVYDSNGKQIERIKERGFINRSLIGSGTLYSDNRLSYLNYTLKDYPTTIVYESEVETNSTIFLRSWRPLRNYNLSVEESSYRLINPEAIPMRFEERNLEDLELQKNTGEYELTYKAKNIPALKKEVLSPDILSFTPQVLVALNKFSLVGVKGEATNWKELGKWQYDYLLQDKMELPQETIAKIAKLTAQASSAKEKARIIYNYVQENTRYISVQLGIGGWEPMSATQVDELGYGDCKALTNYTKALLDSQNIPSYYTVIYGGERNNIDPDFASMQGNHVILNLPLPDEEVWLECTSQTTPFNYLGDFTDDRKALKITPDGGEIVTTPNYSTAVNLKESFSEIKLDVNGGFTANFKRKQTGVPYGEMYGIYNIKKAHQKTHYLEQWGHLKGLIIEDISFKNNRDSVLFVEKLALKGVKLASKAGKRLLLPVNFMPLKLYELPRSKARQLPVVIERGATYKDVFEYKLPKGFNIEAMPEAINMKNEFGNFSLVTSIIEGTEPVLKVKRLLVLKQGSWKSEKYQAYREFMNKINTYTNQKAVLVSN